MAHLLLCLSSGAYEKMWMILCTKRFKDVNEAAFQPSRCCLACWTTLNLVLNKNLVIIQSKVLFSYSCRPWLCKMKECKICVHKYGEREMMFITTQPLHIQACIPADVTWPNTWGVIIKYASFKMQKYNLPSIWSRDHSAVSEEFKHSCKVHFLLHRGCN